MSDFRDPNLPRPSMAPPPPPPAGFGAAPAAPVYSSPGIDQGPYGSPGGSVQPTRPPRPEVAVGGWLMLLGGVVAVIGSFLTWFTLDGRAFTGFSRGTDGQTKDGPAFLVLGLILIGLGIALLVARKVLAVTIIGIVIAAITVLSGFADLSTVSDADDKAKLLGVDFSRGPGLYLCILGALVALGGSIAATAKRRR